MAGGALEVAAKGRTSDFVVKGPPEKYLTPEVIRALARQTMAAQQNLSQPQPMTQPQGLGPGSAAPCSQMTAGLTASAGCDVGTASRGSLLVSRADCARSFDCSDGYPGAATALVASTLGGRRSPATSQLPPPPPMPPAAPLAGRPPTPTPPAPGSSLCASGHGGICGGATCSQLTGQGDLHRPRQPPPLQDGRPRSPGGLCQSRSPLQRARARPSREATPTPKRPQTQPQQQGRSVTPRTTRTPGRAAPPRPPQSPAAPNDSSPSGGGGGGSAKTLRASTSASALPQTARRAATPQTPLAGRASPKRSSSTDALARGTRTRNTSQEAGSRLYQHAQVMRARLTASRESQIRHESVGMYQPTINAKSRELAKDVEPLVGRSENVQRMREETRESIRNQLDERERTEATYHPQITVRAQCMERGTDDWQRWEERRRKRISTEQNTRQDKEREHCTFQPQLCAGTERLARRQGILTSFERLAQDTHWRSTAATTTRGQPTGEGGSGGAPACAAEGKPAGAARGAAVGKGGANAWPGGGQSPLISFEDFMGDQRSSTPPNQRGFSSSASRSKQPQPCGAAAAGAAAQAQTPPPRPRPVTAAEARQRAAEVVPFDAFVERVGGSGGTEDELLLTEPLRDSSRPNATRSSARRNGGGATAATTIGAAAASVTPGAGSSATARTANSPAARSATPCRSKTPGRDRPGCAGASPRRIVAASPEGYGPPEGKLRQVRGPNVITYNSNFQDVLQRTLQGCP